MTLLVAATLLALAARLQDAPPPEDVTVTARRLQRLDIVLKRRRGALVCRYKRSSGDAALDAAACDISVGCYRKPTDVTDIKTCITSGLTALIAPPTDPK